MKKFRKIIIIRHGSYDYETNEINSKGIDEMLGLVDRLKHHLVGEDNVLFLSSSAPRAVGSAEVLFKKIGIPYKTTISLWSDTLHCQDNKIALSFIDSKALEMNSDVIIILTHLEYARDLPLIILKNSGMDYLRSISLQKGEMLVLDLAKIEVI